MDEIIDGKYKQAELETMSPGWIDRVDKCVRSLYLEKGLCSVCTYYYRCADEGYLAKINGDELR